MTDRENLIALFDHFGIKDWKEQEYMVDHLIAHGVTVQEWIPVTERLPDPFENVLVFRDGKISIDYHEENGWFSYDFNGKRATHWQPIPQPPKGE